MSDHELIIKVIAWAADRLNACERTIRESPRRQSRDWAYGEKVGIQAMLDILAGKDVPR